MSRNVPRRKEAYSEMQKLQDLGNSLAHSGLGGWDDSTSELSLDTGSRDLSSKGVFKKQR